MVQNVSGSGIVVVLTTSVSFNGLGFTVSQFADDADPLDIGNIDIAESAMGLNGDLITWSKATPIPMTLNVIPGSLDDENLQILADANRVGQGKIVAGDVIGATITYPDASVVQLTGGIVKGYTPGNSVSSSMRQKSKGYMFIFQGKA